MIIENPKKLIRYDCIGKTYGYLSVKSIISGSGKATKFLCECVCGKQIERTLGSLESSKYPSCGCKKKEIMQRACRKDLTGQRFGRLVVEKMLWDFHPTKCECVCDCGKKTVVIGTQLTYGKTKSCGCLWRERISEVNTKDLSGEVTASGVKFIEQVRKNKHGVWIWKCQCPCGNFFEEIPAKVLNGHHISCGCMNRSSGEETIQYILEKYKYKYSREYTFEDCRYIGKLRFDFAVFNEINELLALIEYDGKQHFVSSPFFGGDEALKELQIRDAIKNEYCHTNNIPLFRFPYYMKPGDIEKEIVDKIFDQESVETAG